MSKKHISVTRMSRNRFSVKEDGISYTVSRTVDGMKCECMVFNEQHNCIHIDMVLDLMKHDEKPSRILEVCPECHSNKLQRSGKRKTKLGNRQRYLCMNCDHRFVERINEFTGTKIHPKVICEALNRIASGESYRVAAKNITKHGTYITKSAIGYWLQKYTKMMTDYYDSMIPKVGETLSVDETMINVKRTLPMKKRGHKMWLWNSIDVRTKFALASCMTKTRSVKDATRIINKSLAISQTSPKFVITDNLAGYRSAIDGIGDSTVQVPTRSITNGFTNRAVERYNGTLKDSLKMRRGLGTEESAETFVNYLRIYYNFARPHMGIDGLTPAQKAGLDVPADIESIVSKAVGHSHTKKLPQHIRLLKPWLGYLVIGNVDDRFVIGIAATHWIPNSEYSMIKAILACCGFEWVNTHEQTRQWVQVDKKILEPIKIFKPKKISRESV